MSLHRRHFLALLGTSQGTFAAESSSPLTIAIPEDVWHDTKLFLAGRSPENVSDYRGQHSRRDVVELILAHRALRLGGYQGTIQWVVINAYERLLRELAAGTVTMTGTSLWGSDVSRFKTKIVATPPLIQRGQFEAGLFSTQDHAIALARTLPQGISQLSAVCHPAWRTDWETLRSVGVGDIQVAHSWNSMVLMVARRKVDFLLAPFSTQSNLSMQAMGQSLYAIPGWKVALEGERVWGVSTTHPTGAATIAALQTGIAQLQRAHEIQGAYSGCGFFNPQVMHWSTLRSRQQGVQKP